MKLLKDMTKAELIEEYYSVTAYIMEHEQNLSDAEYKAGELRANNIERRLIRHHNYYIGIEE